MKRRIRISALSVAIALAACAASAIPLTAQPGTNGTAVNTRWVGVWQGKLEGFPGVVLTLGDDLGDLSGTVVFTAIRDGSVAGHVTHVIMHPRVDGNRLSFQVKRPDGAEDIVDMFLNLNSDGKGQLVCQKWCSAAPIAMDKIP
jgi:hypothetical protein